jgi:hypothetical protein
MAAEDLNQIKERLESMVSGMSKELANRRAYCYDCKDFVIDMYSHKAKFLPLKHKTINLPQLIGPTPAGRPITDESQALFLKIKTLREQGFALREIAKKLGITYSKAHYLLYSPAYNKKQPVVTGVKHKQHKHLSVIGADDNVNGSTPESEWHSGFATASVRYWLQDYAKEHSLELSTLTDSVVQNLKGR